MVTEHMTPEAALQAVRQQAPWVDPNPGFMHQLTLFAEMSHTLDPSHGPYQAMLLSQQRQLATLNTRPLPKHCKVRCTLNSCSDCALVGHLLHTVCAQSAFWCCCDQTCLSATAVGCAQCMRPVE